MRIVVWLFRALVVLVVMRFVLRLVNPARARPAPGRPAGRPAERLGGILVRCATCGTHVPQERSIAAGVGAAVRHFCSTDCQQAAPRTTSPPAAQKSQGT